MRLLIDYDWPGNVRELEHVIERVVIEGGEAPIRRELGQALARAAKPLMPAPPAARVAAPGPTASVSPATIAAAAVETGNYSLKDVSRTAAREAEREMILKMLQHTRWNRKETAEILGISYKALLYKIKENGLDKAS
jgi:DNA-binding NtrC family response regulator